MLTFEFKHSKGNFPHISGGSNYWSTLSVLFPNPATRPLPSGHSTFVEIWQDRNSLRGKLKPQGDGVLDINISFPPRPFPRASTGLSGGTVSPETERENDKQTQEAESGNKKYRVARTPLPVCVVILCQDVGVPPDGSKGQRGNTYYLKKWAAVPPRKRERETTFYVKVLVLPRMGPKDDGGTHK